ncbi:tetraacyldisaccharide 4'-kinase [Oscillatoria amoena NRMC-F 0135]|nr:tetraacyldisaccharide 4'-kinase [Oscillatoria amoena NRMC-F 0135]
MVNRIFARAYVRPQVKAFMSVFKFLLLPFAMLYDMITGIRNSLYDRQLKPSARFDFPVIGIGNLAIGGTGKTPMVEHLIRLLSAQTKVATLSRGYGRKTKGLRFASQSDSPRTIGDEPMQLYSKYGHQVVVAVCEDRAFGIPNILQEHPECGVILLDDALQHRRVIPGFMILLTDYYRPFYADHVLPYGRLREGPEGALRTDVIVVTKCPHDIPEETMMMMENAIHRIAQKPVYFSTIRYSDPVAVDGAAAPVSANVVLITGIANPKILEDYISRNFNLLRHFEFRDHHFYSKRDIDRVVDFVSTQKGQISVITTEKDLVKLSGEELRPAIGKLDLFYLPMEIDFVRNGKDFDTLVLDYLKRATPQ